MTDGDDDVQPTRGGPAGPGGEGPVAASLLVATAAALGLAGVYIAGGQPQAEGALLFVSLTGIGVGLVLWAKRLLPQGQVTDERGTLPSSEEDRADAAEDFEDREALFTQRRRLLRLLAAAGGALGVALLFPIRSLGPSPGRSLEQTAWRKGVRLVDLNGQPVRADALALGSILTVFPEGLTQAADSVAVLIRVEEDRLRPASHPAEGWAPRGNVAYSKICTHVGCPVGLYQKAVHELLCPCHQSTFDVLDGARPVFGPAARPLPQLPLDVDPQGFLVARGDFDAPVGPGFWNLG